MFEVASSSATPTKHNYFRESSRFVAGVGKVLPAQTTLGFRDSPGDQNNSQQHHPPAPGPAGSLSKSTSSSNISSSPPLCSVTLSSSSADLQTVTTALLHLLLCQAKGLSLTGSALHPFFSRDQKKESAVPLES